MPTSFEALNMSQLSYAFSQKERYLETINLDTKNPLATIFNCSTFMGLIESEGPSVQSFAEEIYHGGVGDDGENKVIAAVKYLSQRGWEYFAHTQEDDTTGYQCLVFINDVRQEIVLAHRGTVNPLDPAFKLNALCDIQILQGVRAELTRELCALLRALQSFVTNIVRKKRSDGYTQYKVFQTGHSLGGFLAECASAYLALPKSFDAGLTAFGKISCEDRLHSPRYSDTQAITFDSIGAVNVLTKLGITSVVDSLVNQHYFLVPNIANTANLHYNGLRYALLELEKSNLHYVPDDSHDVDLPINCLESLEEILLTEVTHRLANFAKCFDPLTGNACNKWLILNWPQASNFFQQGKRPNIYGSMWEIKWWQGFAVNAAHYETKNADGEGVISFSHIRDGSVELQNLLQNQAEMVTHL